MKYTFFWNGPLSQWHPSEFTIDDLNFCTAEQYMMYMKAIVFDDTEIAECILQERSPKIQKALGRKVRGFDVDQWNAVAKDIVYAGNYAKFTQNDDLKECLFATGDTLLVEASPFDKIWGIGLDEITASVTPPDQWKGTNWLGEVLTKLRDDLLKEEFNALISDPMTVGERYSNEGQAKLDRISELRDQLRLWNGEMSY